METAAGREGADEPLGQAGEPVRLPSHFDMAAAGALKPRILAEQDRKGELVLDGSEVEKVSTAGIQLMVAADRKLMEGGGSLRLREASDALRAGLTDIGLGEALKRWEGTNV